MASSLPDELLVQILQSAAQERTSLVALCLVSHHIRRLVLPWLYGDISRLKSAESAQSLLITLSTSQYLCPLVISLDLIPHTPRDDDAFFASANASLRRMTNLRALSLPPGYPTSILAGCHFRLRTLSCAFDNDDVLEGFLRTQELLHELRISGSHASKTSENSILPRLAVVRAITVWLERLVPSRRVHTIEVLDDARWQNAWILSSGADRIHSLTVSSACLIENLDWMLRLTSIRDLTIIGLDQATDTIPRVLSAARALNPENLEFLIAATSDTFKNREASQDGLTCQEVYVTMQHFLNPAPSSLRRLVIRTTMPEGVDFCRRWLFHPVLEIFTLLVD
ncbi:hypothetical protein AURDEDRAFT_163153 [Auricularia subglabra TFB-10046 SS5]|nr:hypothetical protein AURDEDRAFT_163153 [Auricularia subglabra TFB-10046 SS5]